MMRHGPSFRTRASHRDALTWLLLLTFVVAGISGAWARSAPHCDAHGHYPHAHATHATLVSGQAQPSGMVAAHSVDEGAAAATAQLAECVDTSAIDGDAPHFGEHGCSPCCSVAGILASSFEFPSRPVLGAPRPWGVDAGTAHKPVDPDRPPIV